MSNMSSESEERLISRDCIDSPTNDDVSPERNMIGNGTLKKGPWTSAEDAILVDYVNKHGEGNWNAVQKHSGLSRCGKSCRLRWANHLRPDLKKGAFTPEEERKIIELHAKMGNKWARMAVELPGRTDNEIKNFWNTRTKRRQRAGLPIYPPDICLQSLNVNTQTQNTVTFGNGDTSHSEIFPNNNFQIPAVQFKNLELNHNLYPANILDLPGSSLLDIPGGSLLPHGLLGPTCNNNNNNTDINNLLFPNTHPPKRIRTCDGNGIFPTGNLYQDDKFTQSYDHNVHGDIPPSSSSLFSGSHAYFNGNPSSSEPVISRAQKMELPSLQFDAPSSPLPSLESVDTLIQSNLIGQSQSQRKSDSTLLHNRNSGLLEAVLLQSQNLKMSNSNASNVPRDITTDSSSQNLQGDDDWGLYGGDTMSPLGHSAASVISEYTPHISGSSLDEHQSVETISVKQEAAESGVKQTDREDYNQNHINYLRPDFLLGSNWFGSTSNPDHNKDHFVDNDPIASLLGDDFYTDSKHVSDSPFQGHFDSGKWDDDISEIYRGSGNC